MVNLKLTKELDKKAIDATLFKQIVASPGYLCNSKSNINYGIGIISIFVNNPRISHLIFAKHILRYLRGTLDLDKFFLEEA